MHNVEVNGVLTLNRVLTVTGNGYSELGVAPLLGRLLTPEDSNPSSGTTSQVAVLGYEFWQRRFGESYDLIDKCFQCLDVGARRPGDREAMASGRQPSSFERGEGDDQGLAK